MKNKELGKILKQLKNLESAGTPSVDFVKRNREILLMQVKNSQGEQRGFSVKRAWELFGSIMNDGLAKTIVRPALVGVLALGVVLGGWAATVSASFGSLPGDTLYSVKLITEKAQVSFASAEDKPSLHVEFAGRRIEEVAKIAEKDSIINKEERTKQAVKSLNKQLSAVKETLTDLESKDANKAIEVARLVDRKTTEYTNTLEKTKETVSEDIKKDMEKATDLANDAGIKAVKVIVEQSGTEPSEELTNNVEAKLKIVEEKVQHIDLGSDEGGVNSSAVEIALGTLGEAKEQLESQNLESAMNKLVEAKNLVNSVSDLPLVNSSSTNSGNSTSTDVGTTENNDSSTSSIKL